MTISLLKRSWLRTAILLLLTLWINAVSAQELRGCRPLPTRSEPLTVSRDNTEGLLFEVQGPEGIPSSHLFGTMHVNDADIVDVNTQVSKILEQSRTFVMEALFNEQSVADFSRMMLQEHSDELRQGLTPSIFESMIEQLGTRRINGSLARRLKPWAAFMMLSVPPQQQKLPLDLVLLERAKRHGLKLSGLETLKEQAEALDGLSPQDQLSLLRDVVCHAATINGDLSEIKDLYRRKALGRLLSAALKYADAGDHHYRHLMDVLLHQRNARMIERMGPLLQQGGAFIAVGALHLPGTQGLLTLVRQQGYRVIRKY